MVKFGTLNSDGTVSNIREIKQSDIATCKHFILTPEHYNDDGSCKCNDLKHRKMMIAEWGYSEADF